ncbi:unnamed protein product [Strongylus vulgaris]|uniref:ShKT domain-containing protein n=1 Tax=Strongylus vulgaris TaxID=40348 RepID=A0A3P7JAR7_STRVU|nr:unnamed protein product [Strongylus vulgaris]
MADNSYICGPSRELDGSIVTFLNEDEGLACTACETRRQKPPTEACGVRTKGKGRDEEPRIGCFPIPQLCLDDYTLRYANAFPEELERARARAESRTSLLERGSNEHGSESRFHGLDTNRLSKSKSNLAHENAVDNEQALPSLTSTTTTAIPLVDKKSKGNQISPFFTTTPDLDKKDSASDFQDITDFDTPFSTAIPEMTRIISELHFPSTTTKVPLILPTLIPSDLGTATVVSQTLLTTVPQGLTASRVSTQVEEKETESIPEEVEEDVRDNLAHKRRGHHFFGTTTVPTTTTTIPTTTTPKLCKDKHKLCCFWAVAGECETNPFWMRVQCAKTCGTCNCPHNHSQADDDKHDYYHHYYNYDNNNY